MTLRWGEIAGAALLGATAACSTSSAGDTSSSAAQPNPFVGTWSCVGDSKTRITSPAPLPETTRTTSTIVTITADGPGHVSSSLATEGGGTCVLPSTLSADRTTLTADVPQSCTWETGETYAYQSGSSTIAADGRGYVSEAVWTVTGKTASGAEFSGTGSTTSTCTRL